MKRVMIVCPTTKREVHTGRVYDPELFETIVIRDQLMECPACGELHTWSKEDAHLEGPIEPESTWSPDWA